MRVVSDHESMAVNAIYSSCTSHCRDPFISFSLSVKQLQQAVCGPQGVHSPRVTKKNFFLGIFVGMRQTWGWIWWVHPHKEIKKVVAGSIWRIRPWKRGWRLKKVIKFSVKNKVHPRRQNPGYACRSYTVHSKTQAFKCHADKTAWSWCWIADYQVWIQ